MKLLRELFVDNPMRIELLRFQRRFLGVRANNAINIILIVLFGFMYAGLLMIVGYFNEFTSPIFVTMIQTLIFTFMGPGMLHQAISGERERRTWELLLVAPITKLQIITGKFTAGLISVGLVAAVMLLPVLITLSGKKEMPSLFNVFMLELHSITFGVFAMALGLFFSTRYNRSFMALGASLGVMFLWLLVTPIVLSVLVRDLGRQFVETVNCMNPFASQVMIEELTRNGAYDMRFDHPGRGTILLLGPIVYVFGTVALVAISAFGLARKDRDTPAAQGRRNA